MIKKIIVAFLALISTLGIVFTLNQDMQASTSDTIPLKKNDKIYLGEYEGNIIGWDVIKADNTEALLGTHVYLKNVQKCNAKTQNTAYSTGVSFCSYKSTNSEYEDSGLYKESVILNNGFKDYEKNIINLNANYDGEYAFVPNTIDVKTNGNFGIDAVDGTVGYNNPALTFSWLRDTLFDPDNYSITNFEINAVFINQPIAKEDVYLDSTGVFPGAFFGGSWGQLMNGEYQTGYYRPLMFLKNSDIVMALDATFNQSALNAVIPSTSVIGDQTLNGVRKVRYYDSSYSASLKGLKTSKGVTLKNNSISKGAKMKVQATTNVHEDAYASALIYNADGELKYYKVLGKTNASGEYEFDTTNLPLGSYSMAIVSEEISSLKGNRPSAASKISSQLAFTVVEPLGVAYSPVYGSGTATANTYEYTKNVNENQIVGNVTLSQGVAPYALEIIADEGGSQDYKNFKLSSSSNITDDVKVQIDPDGPALNSTKKSLEVKAGGYKFCIAAVDANGHPVDTLDNKTLKKCITINVLKTTPTLSYTTATTTDISITSQDYIDTITTSNNELKLGGIQPEFSLTGGIAGVLNVAQGSDNINTFVVSIVDTHTGVNLPSTFTLNTKLPATKNFNAVTTPITKSICAYKELSSLTWIADKSIYSTADVESGKQVGTLKAVDGVEKFVYSLTSSADDGYIAADASDNTSFQISSTPINGGETVAVKTVNNLVENKDGYKIQFKVEDGKGNTAYQKAIISVNAKAQDPINFRDKAGGSVITKKSLVLDSKTDTVFADGGSTGTQKPMEYTIADKSDQNNNIDGNEYLEVHLTNGTLTAKKVGTVKVKATKPGDANYAPISKFIDVTIEPSQRTLTFDNVDNPRNIKNGSVDLVETVTKSKSATNDALSYTSNNTEVVDIDNDGNLTIKSVGEATIIAEVVDEDGNYESASCEKVIKVYDGMVGTFTQGTILQAENTAMTGRAIGGVSVQGGQSSPGYAISNESSAKNRDANLFSIDPSYGSISLKTNVTASHLNGKYDIIRKNYVLKVQIDVMDGNTKSTTVDCEIAMQGVNLNSVSFANAEGVATSKLSYPYSPGGTFVLGLTGNSGNATAAYRLKDDASMPNDVIGPVVGNMVTIQNANDPTVNAKAVKVEAVIPANGGYDGKTIECEVAIVKAEQSAFKFSKETLELYPEGSLAPEFEGKMTPGPLTLTSDNQSIISIDGTTIRATKKEASTTIKAVWKGNRNYKDGVAMAKVTVTSAPAYPFEIDVPSFTYGDEKANASIISNGATLGANLKQKWSSSDDDVATIDEASGEITVLSAGNTTITCEQTSDKDADVKASIQLYVKQRPITLKYEDKSMYTGEQMKSFAWESEVHSGSLVESDALSSFPIPANSISTAPDTLSKGEYKIQGSYSTDEKRQAVVKNYEVTILEGKLEVQLDTPELHWLNLKGETSGDVIDESKWIKENVVVDVKADSQGSVLYNQISQDKVIWDTSLTIASEGIHNSDIWFKSETGVHAGAISDKLTKTIKIDKTAPIIQSITGEPSNRDGLAKFLNAITFNKLFRPGIEVEIVSIDPTTNAKQVSDLKEIRYKIYEADKITGEINSKVFDEGVVEVTKNKVNLPALDIGNYEVQAIAVDHAGNESEMKSSRLHIKSWGESSDDNELPDINIDVSGDGIADINITKPGEKKPYLNIDTDGDGNPDINISAVNEVVEPGVTKPYLNIIDPETPWNPTVKIDFDKDGTLDFRIDDSLEAILSLDSNEDYIPDLNIDLDDDYVPELNVDVNGDRKTPETNIDSRGDGVANINVDKEGDGTPDIAIATGYTWDPKDEVKRDGKTIYATVIGIKPDSKDSLTDGGVVVEPSDPGTSFLPNYALKVNNVTDKTSAKEKDAILSKSGNKKGEVKVVFDVNLLEDNKVIQPNGLIKVSIPIDETIKNPKLMMKGEDGTWNFIEAEKINGFYVFTTSYIGSVSIVGDKEEVVEEEPTPPTTKPITSVKGNYMNGMGGAGTGDNTNVQAITFFGVISFIVLATFTIKMRKQTK